ncbi:MAG: PAS domain S-box protein [Pseudanabaena sp. ELA607]
MVNHITALNDLDIKSAIIRHPLVLPPETLITEVIVQMSRDVASCEITLGDGNPNWLNRSLREVQLDARSSCVLVAVDQHLLGIFTERDVVSLIAHQQPLDNLRLADVMVKHIITLPEAEFTDIFVPINLLQRHQIRHLPITDTQGKLVGIITHESLRQIARPIDLLRLRQVHEVMTRQVICTHPEATILEISRLMSQHRISSVVITEPHHQPHHNQLSQGDVLAPITEDAPSDSNLTAVKPTIKPIGIVTERDLVQFQAIGLNTEQCTAAAIMSTPVFTVLPEDHLWTVQQIMARHLIRRVIVTDRQNNLMGIVTQTSLLQILNPLELYNVTEFLEAKVHQLEIEKVQILSQRAEALEEEVQNRTVQLERTLRREKLINQVAQQIFNSLDLNEILSACVMEIRHFLACDRVIVHQCQGANKGTDSGVIIAESVKPSFKVLLGEHIDFNYCQNYCHNYYCEKELSQCVPREEQVIVPNIDVAGYAPAQVALFKKYQVKASLLTPIRLGGNLWGLLVAQQCATSRNWQPEEAQLLQDLSVQLSIAIHQALVYSRVEQQVAELTLWRKRYEAAESTSGQLIYEYNHQTGNMVFGASIERTLGYTSINAPQTMADYLALIHQDDLAEVTKRLTESITHETPCHCQYRLLHQRGTYIWIEGRGQWLMDANHQANVMVGMLSDITESKKIEQSLKKQRDLNQLIAQITSRFVTVADQDLDHEINRTLALIGTVTDSDTSYIFSLDHATATKSMTHEWSKVGCPQNISVSQNLSLAQCPWLTEHLSQREMCYVSDMNHPPAEAIIEVEIWRQLHLKAILLLPVFQQNIVTGYIGFGSFTQPMYWEPEMIDLLAVMGQTIINAQERAINRRKLEALNHNLEAEIIKRTEEFRHVYALQQGILNSFDYAIVATDLDGKIRTFNAGAEKLLGYTASELVGKATPAIFHDVAEIIEYAALLSTELGREITPGIEVFTAPLEAGIVDTKEWTSIRKDGTRFPISLSIISLQDMDNQRIGFVGIAKDLTEKKQIAEALERSEKRFRRVFDANVVGIMFTDFTGKVTDANDYFLNLLGYTRDELEHGLINWVSLTPLAYRQQDLDVIAQLKVHHAVAPWEKAYYHRDGHAVPILIAVALLEYAQNNHGSCVCIVIDITEQKHSENQLREAQQFISTVINTIPLPIFWKDQHSTFVGCNRCLADMLQFTDSDEIIGKTDFDISLTEEQAENYRNSDQAVIHSGKPLLGIPETLILPDGQQHRIETHKAPLRNWQGEIIGLVGMFQDVTQRKADEEALRLNEELFRNAFNNTTVGMSLILISGRFFKINQAFAEFLGYEVAELQTMTFIDITHPEDLVPSRIGTQKVLNGELPSYHTEKRYITKSGATVWGLLSLSLVRDLEQAPLYFVAQVQDITERKQALLNLQASESRFRRIFDSKVVGMLLADFEGNILDANDRFLEILGYTRAEFTQNQIRWDLSTPYEHQAKDLEAMNYLREHSAITPWEKEYYRKDGSRVPILIGAALLPNSKNQTICVVMDISDRKAVEKALQDSEERFRQLAQAIDAVFWIMSLDRRSWVYVSPAYAKIWGRNYIDLYTNADAWLDTIHPDDRCRVIEALPQQINGDFNQEYRIIRPDGEVRWIHDRAFPMHSERSEVYLIAGIAEDITTRKIAESQLHYSNDQLMRITRLKDEFLASMSHELRTPLNAILGMAEGLQDHVFGPLNESQMKSIQTIERSGTHLLALINDILDLSKVESGQVELAFSSIAVPMLIQTSLSFIRQQARKKQIHIETQIPPHLPYVVVDQLRLNQVLINLLNNAIKFTPQGGKITIEVNYPCPPLGHSLGKINPTLLQLSDLSDLSDADFLRIAIIDTGIGIVAENLHKLFQPFIQIDSALNRQYEGTGLGLALVKRLVELHGGHIYVTSEAGQGSCFVFDLPCNANTAAPKVPTEELPSQSAPDITGTPKLILLVEDNLMIISTVSSYLKAKGYQIMVANNGVEAIEKAQTANPDVILMDIQMPGMDGLEAMQRIRANPELVKTPIIALTALAMEGDRERCLAAGANEYMSKPVKMKQLINTIEIVFSHAYNQ